MKVDIMLTMLVDKQPYLKYVQSNIHNSSYTITIAQINSYTLYSNSITSLMCTMVVILLGIDDRGV